MTISGHWTWTGCDLSRLAFFACPTNYFRIARYTQSTVSVAWLQCWSVLQWITLAKLAKCISFYARKNPRTSVITDLFCTVSRLNTTHKHIALSRSHERWNERIFFRIYIRFLSPSLLSENFENRFFFFSFFQQRWILRSSVIQSIHMVSSFVVLTSQQTRNTRCEDSGTEYEMVRTTQALHQQKRCSLATFVWMMMCAEHDKMHLLIRF